MTPEQQDLINALHLQTLAIWMGASMVTLAVLAVLIVWAIEYRRDRRDESEMDGRTAVLAKQSFSGL